MAVRPLPNTQATAGRRQTQRAINKVGDMWGDVYHQAERLAQDEMQKIQESAVPKKRGFFGDVLYGVIGYDVNDGSWDPMQLAFNLISGATGGLSGILLQGVNAYRNFEQYKTQMSGDAQEQYRATLDRYTQDFGGLKVLKQLSENAEDLMYGTGSFQGQGLEDFIKGDALSNMYVDLAASIGAPMIGELFGTFKNIPFLGEYGSGLFDKASEYGAGVLDDIGILEPLTTFGEGVGTSMFGEGWSIDPLTTMLTNQVGDQVTQHGALLPQLPASIYKSLINQQRR